MYLSLIHHNFNIKNYTVFAYKIHKKGEKWTFLHQKASFFLSNPYGQCLHPHLQQYPLFKWYFSVKTR